MQKYAFAHNTYYCIIFRFQIDANPASINLESLRIRVRNAKNDVNDIIRQLNLLRDDAEEDTNTEVTEKWDEEQKSFREYKNLLLKEIKVIILIDLQSSNRS